MLLSVLRLVQLKVRAPLALPVLCKFERRSDTHWQSQWHATLFTGKASGTRPGRNWSGFLLPQFA